uniref:WD repeat-containing protein 89 n=1 Tax=Graphocephala atropunctata TaxID=36148 RepID=A0A1B6KZQ3_9HEMI
MIETHQSGSDEEGYGCDITPEMENIYKKPFYLDHEEAITLKKNYILHMSAITIGSETKLGLGLSTYDACVYSVGTSLRCSSSLPAENSPVVNVRFAPNNDSLLYVGYNQGTVKLWDLRDTKQCVQEFKEPEGRQGKDAHKKAFSSFDVNCEGRFVCAGTEVTDGDAFLLFWDTRQASLLGGYWECHTDVVTQVRFHTSDKDHLLSGSTDGLINMYDLSQTEEDEALLQSFNTESSVEKLCWHEGKIATISCVTHTADVQLWHLDDSSPYNTFSRSDIASALQTRKDSLEESLYVADIHSTSEPDSLLVLAGSSLSNGKFLRSATMSSGKLDRLSYFDGNKQIVRCSWFDPQAEVLVTGGEAGILSLWKTEKGDATANPSQLKATSKMKEKAHKTKARPY